MNRYNHYKSDRRGRRFYLVILVTGRESGEGEKSFIIRNIQCLIYVKEIKEDKIFIASLNNYSYNLLACVA